MKNIFDVLRQKETELQKVQKEVEALRVAARLLVDETDEQNVSEPSASSAGRTRPTRAPMGVTSSPLSALPVSSSVQSQFP